MSNNGVFSIIVCICQQIKDHQYGTEAYCERPRVLYATGLHGVRPFGICYRLWKKAHGKAMKQYAGLKTVPKYADWFDAFDALEEHLSNLPAK